MFVVLFYLEHAIVIELPIFSPTFYLNKVANDEDSLVLCRTTIRYFFVIPLVHAYTIS